MAVFNVVSMVGCLDVCEKKLWCIKKGKNYNKKKNYLKLLYRYRDCCRYRGTYVVYIPSFALSRSTNIQWESD